VRALDLGIEDVPLFSAVMLSQFDLVAAAAAAVLVAVLALLFNKTRIGVSLRAVADDTRRRCPSASTSTASGRSSGRWPGWSGWWPGCCGARARACSSRCRWWCSRPAGADHRRLHLDRRGDRRRADRRRGENLAEVYLGPLIGGGITPWFAYFLALAFLYIRPAGLFGERAIERV
jgi:branched-chain amino acid transport system permease protein